METMDYQSRSSKYNTWTPAEAKKQLASSQYLAARMRQQPIRTASVRHKPRPPPLVVTNLDNDSGELAKATTNMSVNECSFSSAKSKLSLMSAESLTSSTSLTPRKCISPCGNKSHLKSSSSKSSLSSSTYKVFQGPLANFKRLFNSMPKPFASNSQLTLSKSKHRQSTPDRDQDRGLGQNKRPQAYSSASSSLSVCESFLNRSQSPPECSPPPPPPGELKSMSYMNAIKYSNYDEFTRSRNETPATIDGSTIYCGAATLGRPRNVKRLPISLFNQNVQQPQQQQQQATYNHQTSSDSDTNSDWQLTSLPVSYERNLATVYEESKMNIHNTAINNNSIVNNAVTAISGHSPTYQFIQSGDHHLSVRPPDKFDDVDSAISASQQIVTHQTFGRPLSFSRTSTNQNSSHNSLTSIATTDSVLDYHRQVATAYRFSFGQPITSNEKTSAVQKNAGLPPRMPTSNTITTSSEQKQDTSSGNSSNCSSQLNGIDSFDKQASLDAADKVSYSDYSNSTYGNLNGLDNEADTTLLSDTSTLQGDQTSSATLATKCADLERMVTTLKNKLVCKEKELTDMQLSQLNKDYSIDRLKSQASKLEKENAQLKAMLVRSSNSTNHISKIYL